MHYIIHLVVFSALVTSVVLGNSNGSCDSGAEWELDEGSMTLTITGNSVLHDCNPPNKELIRTVILSEGFTRITAYTFADWASLSSISIPDSISTVDKNAFRNAAALTSFHLGKSMSLFAAGALWNCTRVSTVTVDKENPNFILDNNVVFNKAKTAIVWHPPALATAKYTIPAGVQTIGQCCFAFCSNLKKVKIPDSVTQIEYAGFYRSGLESVIIPESVVNIAQEAFRSSTSLESVAYLGDSDPAEMKDARIFKECDKLGCICVPPTYGSETFCDSCIDTTCVVSDTSSSSKPPQPSASASVRVSFVSIALALVVVMFC